MWCVWVWCGARVCGVDGVWCGCCVVWMLCSVVWLLVGVCSV